MTYSERELEIIAAALATERLIDFIRFTWHIVEPSRPLIEGWPLEAICEHLEAVSKKKIKRLIVNVPPGMMKSLTTNVFWPAWEWGPRRMPFNRYFCASYNQSLTVRDNVRFRELVTSPLYRKYWGDRFDISASDASKIKLGNNKTGWKLATSIGGVGTGERGDRIILDDPNAVDEAESEAVRTSTNQWLTEVMPTRLNDPRYSAIVCIQQRTHEEDATGTLLSKDDDGDWTHLCIPMEYDSLRHCTTSIGWTDPRSEDGELAWPERFPAEVVTRDKKMLGPYAVAGQFQQSPTVRGGAIIRREWFGTWGDPENPVGQRFPPFSLTIAFLDGAYTTKEENDPSAMIVFGVYADPKNGDPRVMLANAWQGRFELHELVLRVAATCRRYRVDSLLIENKAVGISVQQEMTRLFGRDEFATILVDPAGKDKVARAHAIVPLLASGVLFAPATDWRYMVEDQCAIFPRGSHDDLVDCVVGGIKWLRDTGALMRPAEVREREQEALAARSPAKVIPLYRV